MESFSASQRKRVGSDLASFNGLRQKSKAVFVSVRRVRQQAV